MGAVAERRSPEFPMSYYDQLHPWCIVRLLPNLRRVVVARFRRRNDAEEHLKLLRQMTPTVVYAIVFDVPCNPDSFRLEAHSLPEQFSGLL